MKIWDDFMLDDYAVGVLLGGLWSISCVVVFFLVVLSSGCTDTSYTDVHGNQFRRVRFLMKEDLNDFAFSQDSNSMDILIGSNKGEPPTLKIQVEGSGVQIGGE